MRRPPSLFAISANHSSKKIHLPICCRQVKTNAKGWWVCKGVRLAGSWSGWKERPEEREKKEKEERRHEKTGHILRARCSARHDWDDFAAALWSCSVVVRGGCQGAVAGWGAAENQLQEQTNIKRSEQGTQIWSNEKSSISAVVYFVEFSPYSCLISDFIHTGSWI